MTPMNGSVLKSITSGPPLDASKARAFMEKREEQKEKLKKLAGLLQEAGDILNNLDA
jgi:hypothetical protein